MSMAEVWTKLIVVIECGDGKCRQILLGEEEAIAIMSLIGQLHKGSVRVLEEPIESIAISSSKEE